MPWLQIQGRTDIANRGLGTLTLSLVTQTAGFSAGLDKAGRDLDNRSKKMLSSAKKLGTEIGLALSAIGGIAAAGFAKYVANTIEAEKVQAQLASRIKDTGAIAGRTIEQMNAQADKLQSITIFDDEAIGNVQAMLLTFKDIRDVQFDKATEAVLDLSTAMGIDAQAAALQLGKALNDPIKGISALGRAGVQFSADQRAVIKALVESGEKAKAQELILAELESQMGTAAEAARNTLGGALQGLRNNFDNLLEGDTSGSGLKGTVDAINNLSEELNDPDLKKGIDALATGLLRVAASAIQGTANVGGFLSNVNKVLANAGVVPGDDINQLKARRQAIAERGAESVIGRLFPERVQEELAELDRQIAAYPFRNVVSSVSRTRQPTSGGGGGSGGGKAPKPRELPDFSEEDLRALQAMVAEVSRADVQFEALAATMAGPLAEAEFQHKENLAEITALGQTAGRTSAEVEALKAKEVERYNEQTEAIKATLPPNQQLIEDMREELALLTMSEKQREIAIAQRYLSRDATKAEREEVAKLTEDIRKQNEANANWRELQGNISDGLYDIISGAESAGDAVENFLDRLNSQILSNITDDWAESITDFFKNFASGSSGGGAGGGGFWSSILSAFGFGGARASGGPVQPGRFYEVGESDRPELLMARSGKQYLIPGNQGRVVPMRGRGDFNQTLNFNLAAPTDPRTAQQIAIKAAYEQRRAVARNG